MSARTLAVEDLHLWRGERHVLRGIRFSIGAGDCLELAGPNGSGKTSLLRTICGLTYPESGRILWSGEDVRRDLPSFQGSLAYLGHEPPLKPDLTAGENLHYWIGIRRHVGVEAVDAALARVGGLKWSDRLVRTLSAGQRRRVALAGLALLVVPLWLLDEPTTNLDTEGQQLVGSLVGEHLGRGGMVVAAVHHSLPATVRAVGRLELPP
jgi:heme exporter protein A